MPSRTSKWVLLLCASATLGACGHEHEPRPTGTLTIAFTPLPGSVANLTMSSAVVTVDRIQPIGNVDADDIPMTHVPVDALAMTGTTVSFSRLPQGIYSRLQFSVDSVAIAGTWRGTPFTAMIDMFGGAQVDLAEDAPQQIGPDQNATMTVDMDVGSWFGGDLLDSASASNGQIVCDEENNPSVTAQLSTQIGASFSLH